MHAAPPFTHHRLLMVSPRATSLRTPLRGLAVLLKCWQQSLLGASRLTCAPSKTWTKSIRRHISVPPGLCQARGHGACSSALPTAYIGGQISQRHWGSKTMSGCSAHSISCSEWSCTYVRCVTILHACAIRHLAGAIRLACNDLQATTCRRDSPPCLPLEKGYGQSARALVPLGVGCRQSVSALVPLV